MRKPYIANFLILVVPIDGKPVVKKIKSDIQSMEKVLDSGKADFDYYKDAIIATNTNIKGLEKNKRIRRPGVYGSFYIIGNNRSNNDFCSLTPDQIVHYKNLFSE